MLAQLHSSCIVSQKLLPLFFLGILFGLSAFIACINADQNIT